MERLSVVKPTSQRADDTDAIDEPVACECGVEREHRTGISKKSGKPYDALFCVNKQCETIWNEVKEAQS